jgi:hypothetical protein
VLFQVVGVVESGAGRIFWAKFPQAEIFAAEFIAAEIFASVVDTVDSPLSEYPPDSPLSEHPPDPGVLSLRGLVMYQERS